jgi:hypothetical protein
LFVLDTENEAKKQFNGQPAWHNVTYEKSTEWKMKELFTALGAGDKAGIDFDDKGQINRIGRAVPGKVHVLIHSKVGTYKNAPQFQIDTLAPIPRKEGEEEYPEETGEFMDDGEATAFENAGGVASDESGNSVGEDQWSGSDVPAEDPWAAGPSDDEPPF